MALCEPLVRELTHEAANTRMLLERLPDDQWDYTPHEKSMTLRQLASHIAESLGWVVPTMTLDEMSLDSGEWQPFMAKDRAELLAAFDKNLAEAAACLAQQSDEHLMAMWCMRVDGKEVFNMPRLAVVRSMMLNHLIHHRGQLTVYARVLGVALPMLYGPSADETTM